MLTILYPIALLQAVALPADTVSTAPPPPQPLAQVKYMQGSTFGSANGTYIPLAP